MQGALAYPDLVDAMRRTLSAVPVSLLEADTFNGGENFDTISSSDSVGVNVSLNDVADDGRTGEGDNAVDIENIRGTSGVDTLTGNDEENFIEGFGSGDTISGLGENDVLLGGEGFDVIDGGEGSANCSLGPSNDGTTVNCPCRGPQPGEF